VSQIITAACLETCNPVLDQKIAPPANCSHPQALHPLPVCAPDSQASQLLVSFDLVLQCCQLAFIMLFSYDVFWSHPSQMITGSYAVF